MNGAQGYARVWNDPQDQADCKPSRLDGVAGVISRPSTGSAPVSSPTVPSSSRIGASALRSSKIVKGSTLKIYPGAPHGLPSTKKDQVNADLLAFFKA
jgi:hypothetical protein